MQKSYQLYQPCCLDDKDVGNLTVNTVDENNVMNFQQETDDSNDDDEDVVKLAVNTGDDNSVVKLPLNTVDNMKM